MGEREPIRLIWRGGSSCGVMGRVVSGKDGDAPTVMYPSGVELRWRETVVGSRVPPTDFRDIRASKTRVGGSGVWGWVWVWVGAGVGGGEEEESSSEYE